MRCLWVLLLGAWTGTPVAAQVASVGHAQPSPPSPPSHGWVMLDCESGPLLAHLPPREATGGPRAGWSGVVRPVRPVRETPEAMAGVGDHVYLIYPVRETRDGPIRRVLTVRAVPAGVRGLWTDVPYGSFGPAPVLPGEGRLVDIAVTGGVGEGRVFALQQRAGVVTLHRMDRRAWVQTPLPPELAQIEPVGLAMVSWGDGALLCVRDGGGSRAWRLKPDGSWEPTMLADWGRFWDARWRRGWREEVILGVAEPGGQLGVWSVGREHAWRLGELEDRAGSAAVVLGSSGRLVLVDLDKGGAARVREMSLVTGRTVFEGSAAHKGPVSNGEFRLIVVMLLLVMGAALFVIVRPSGDEGVALPDGWALADPGRRLIASMIDALLTAWVVAPVFGVGLREIITLEVLVHPDASWLAVPATLAVGCVAMSVWEFLLGLTPGKLMTGLRVFRAAPGEPRRLGLFWCLVRNSIKWLIPPVAAMALADPQGRHRGDSAARAVVVTRAALPEPGV